MPLKMPPARIGREHIASHPEPGHDRGRRRRELARGAVENFGGDRVPCLGRSLNDVRDASDRVALESTIVDGVNDLGGRRQLHLFQHEIGQQRDWSALIELADDRRQRGAADPEAATFVTEEISPPAGARGAPVGVTPVGNRPGPGDDDNTRLLARASDQCDECIVDDHRARLVSDAAHDVRHRLRVLRAIDAGYAQTDRIRADVSVTERVFHDSMEDLLHAEFAHDLQVGARAACLGQDLARDRPRAGIRSSYRPRRCPVRAYVRLKYGTFLLSPMERCVSVMASGLRFARLVICSCVVAAACWRSRMSGRMRPTHPCGRSGSRARRWILRRRSAVRWPRRPSAASTPSWFPSACRPRRLPPSTARSKWSRRPGRAVLRVHAWIEVTLAAVAGELPASRDHVLYQHPEWLMVPRELAPDVLKVDVRSPAYLGRLQSLGSRQHTTHRRAVPFPSRARGRRLPRHRVTAAAQRYAVDGVFLDAMRFPGADFDYSRHAMEIFRTETRPQLSPEERTRLDEVESIDPFGYAEEFPDRWRQFRQSRLTNLMSRDAQGARDGESDARRQRRRRGRSQAPRWPTRSRTGRTGWRPA